MGIDIDAGAGRRPRCDRRRNTQIKTPFAGLASGPGSWGETIPFPCMTHRSWQAGLLSTLSRFWTTLLSHATDSSGKYRVSWLQLTIFLLSEDAPLGLAVWLFA